MTDDQHGEGTPQGGGRWDPLPQGDYDDGATAFVKLPEGGIDALLSGDSPLAAPGHGYVPPRITAAPGAGDPAAPGTWSAPAGGTEWPDPNAMPQVPGADDRFTYEPGATQQWTFEEPAAPAAPGHDVTGQWSIPVAGGDLPDESGEFTTSSLVEQWGGTPPATLPGGAPAPWAAQDPGRTWDHPEDQQPPDRPGPPLPDHTGAHPAGGPAAQGYAPQERYATDEPYAHDPAGHPAEFAEPAAPAESTAPLAEPEAVPDADGHAPARAFGRPADGPAGHEEPTSPAAAPQAATAPVTSAAPDAEATAVPATPKAPAAAAVDEEAGPSEHPADAPEAAAPAGGNQAPGAPGKDDTPGSTAAADGDEAAHAREAAPAEEHAAPLPPGDDHPLASYVLRVNGTDRPVTGAWIGESLLYVLRERLGLAGAKDGCSQGECGACNVQVDGRLVASCLVPAVTAAGSEVRTVEGLAADGRPSDVQRALARCGAVQCGFCVPGMAMTVHDLLEGNPAPTELETRQALCGNLCRCSGYRGVLQAVQEVVAEREASHAADDGTDAEAARIPHQAGPGSGGVHPSAFEAPGAFGTPQPAPGGYGGTPDPYAAPDPYGTPGPGGQHGPHDQHYGQDGGQV
ncbi:2Fe-2S iron-sulfur cluster-binding protein [Streptomyces sp. FXJ1.172]|uniref:2Fe-2S iron-sulfur cluster-binding protein n=1 Tax=Streptomyces sp. FXJ1.172 TaxID=710705 RepID=UPI0007CFA5AF|nr:(2Fe-2S)-binding protein [Streptomyces sp. FXJ1.172]WEO97129.1 2Fe-2S iron-sulfur cluster-binding protein [Streptomyces sp. FXJ1.172]